MSSAKLTPKDASLETTGSCYDAFGHATENCLKALAEETLPMMHHASASPANSPFPLVVGITMHLLFHPTEQFFQPYQINE